ncbi:MAG: hypothetical protein KJ757_06645, partial [Planctomycetes bacterium]|nr:hypothetical protein [Planctomycetota bacterium]MBU1518723.1 hypothetical protein [Planctomycetota bacterium]MBU2457890.1 hypothetical protein [Planctomycetota bacterium]MBU2597216.1 hypothetical protein [Planctomycetota bacterium]
FIINNSIACFLRSSSCFCVPIGLIQNPVIFDLFVQQPPPTPPTSQFYPPLADIERAPQILRQPLKIRLVIASAAKVYPPFTRLWRAGGQSRFCPLRDGLRQSNNEDRFVVPTHLLPHLAMRSAEACRDSSQ